MGVQFAGNILVQSDGGPLPISMGGTGQTTATTAINALLPSQSNQSNKVLTSNGTNVFWSATSQAQAGGADTQIQFNDSGTFNGSSKLVINKTTGALTSLSTLTNQGVSITQVAGMYRTLRIQSTGSDRWLMQANNTAEEGANVGSDFELVAVADNGATQNKAFAISRATQVVDFTQTPTVNGVSLSSFSSSQITTALGFTPYDAANPAGYISGITGSNVTTALGYTPYNASNPSGYQTSGQVSSAISAAAYSLPTASTTTLGGVKVDGSTITISGGIISASAGTAAAGTLTGSTLASNVTASSLTSVGTLAGVTIGAGGSGPGVISVRVDNGLTLQGYTGTANDFTIETQAGTGTVMRVPAGTNNAVFAGTVTATSFTGALTGNAATATKLASGNTINGVTFDGSAAITVTAAAGTLTGTTLNSTVTGSSLTSVGTLANLTVTGTITGSISGNAATATSATSATTTSSISNGAANELVYQTGSGTTSFITAPTTASTYLEWTGSAFAWATPAGSGATLGGTNNWTAPQSGAVTAITFASTISQTLNTTNNYSLTMTGNCTMNISGGTAGQSGIIAITQSGAGNTFTFGTGWVSAGGVRPTLSSTNGAIDLLSYYVVSAGVVFVSASTAIA